MVLSISEERYEDFQKETIVDPELQAVLTMEKINGWPDSKQQLAIETEDSTGHSVTKLQQQMDSSSKEHAWLSQRLGDLKFFARATRVI